MRYSNQTVLVSTWGPNARVDQARARVVSQGRSELLHTVWMPLGLARNGGTVAPSPVLRPMLGLRALVVVEQDSVW